MWKQSSAFAAAGALMAVAALAIGRLVGALSLSGSRLAGLLADTADRLLSNQWAWAMLGGAVAGFLVGLIVHAVRFSVAQLDASIEMTQARPIGDDGSEQSLADGTLHRDASITSFDDDTLGRETFARRVAARIESARSGPSVVFGLSGPWGSGKTSALAMIKLALDESDTWTVVEFTPWSATDPHDLIGEFYQAIGDAMPADSAAGRKARTLLMSAIPTTTQLGKVALEGFIDAKLGDGTWGKMAGTLSDDGP